MASSAPSWLHMRHWLFWTGPAEWPRRVLQRQKYSRSACHCSQACRTPAGHTFSDARRAHLDPLLCSALEHSSEYSIRALNSNSASLTVRCCLETILRTALRRFSFSYSLPIHLAQGWSRAPISLPPSLPTAYLPALPSFTASLLSVTPSLQVQIAARFGQPRVGRSRGARTAAPLAAVTRWMTALYLLTLCVPKQTPIPKAVQNPTDPNRFVL
jgi:hypothetical protein